MRKIIDNVHLSFSLKIQPSRKKNANKKETNCVSEIDKMFDSLAEPLTSQTALPKQTLENEDMSVITDPLFFPDCSLGVACLNVPVIDSQNNCILSESKYITLLLTFRIY